MVVGVICLNYTLVLDKFKSKILTKNQEDWIIIQNFIVKDESNFDNLRPPSEN